MVVSERVSDFDIAIDGQPMTDDLQTALVALQVDLCLDVPSMFVIDVFDEELKLIDDAQFAIGNTVKIGMRVDRNESEKEESTLISGEITALEPIFDVEGPTRVRVRGYDRSHRLHRSQKSRVFVQEKDSDIATKIAQEAGLKAQVTSTSTVHEHVFQFHQTDYDFLRERARRVGYVVLMSGDTLVFAPPDKAGSDGPTLEYGAGLQEFRPRMTAAGQKKTVKVYGWDRKTKTPFIGQSASATFDYRAGSSKTGGATADKFGGNDLIIRSYPIWDQSDADGIAASLLNEREAAYLQGEGTCLGHPEIKAGVRVTLEHLGDRFSGKYFVTRATHRFDREGYFTDISLAGLHSDSLAEVIGGGTAAPIERSYRFPGVVPAIVTATNDEEKIGRVKLKFPGIDDQLESRWVPVAQPLAGPQRGFWLIPQPDDEVLVAFEHGDFNRPYVIGSLWNGKDAPPPDGKDAKDAHKVHVLHTESKSKILIDDTSGKEAIEISTDEGHKLRIDKTAKTIEMTTADGQKILLDQTSKKVEVSEPGGIKMTLDGAGKTMTLEGAMTVNVKSSGPVNVEGQGPVAIKSSATVDVSGNGPVNIKGAIVNIN